MYRCSAHFSPPLPSSLSLSFLPSLPLSLLPPFPSSLSPSSLLFLPLSIPSSLSPSSLPFLPSLPPSFPSLPLSLPLFFHLSLLPSYPQSRFPHTPKVLPQGEDGNLNPPSFLSPPFFSLSLPPPSLTLTPSHTSRFFHEVRMVDQKVLGVLHTFDSNVGTHITKSEEHYKTNIRKLIPSSFIQLHTQYITLQCHYAIRKPTSLFQTIRTQLA